MKRVVVIGGGTGSFTVLQGLKEHDIAITAVVSMFDSGGSTGVLKDEYGILPPGDIRRCLIALSEEKILRDLFMYRFDKWSLKDHSFGNLFLTALKEITKSDVKAIKKAAEILKIKGIVLPVTINKSTLCAKLEDGTVIKGEKNIDIPKHDGNIKITDVFLEPEAKIFKATKKAIVNADLIVIGPGDLYTSVVPNLLVKGVCDAIRKNKGKKVYVCNIMTKFGETNGYKASNHLKVIQRFVDVDYIICNTGKKRKLKKYTKECSFPVEIDAVNVKMINGNFVNRSDLIRHNSKKLAKALIRL